MTREYLTILLNDLEHSGLHWLYRQFIDGAIQTKKTGVCRREWLAGKLAKQPKFINSALSIYDRA